MRRQAIILTLILLCGLGNYAVAQRHWSKSYGDSTAIEFRDTFLLPDAAYTSAILLNNKSLAATLVWLQALLYYGSYRLAGTSAKAPPKHLRDYAQLAVELDPSFMSPYDWFISTYLATRKDVSFKDLEHINELLDYAIKLHPQDSALPYQAGLNYIGYSADRAPAERIKELERGIAYLERAAQFADANPLTPSLISYMYRRKAQLEAQLRGEPSEDDRQAQLDFTMSMYRVALEPQLREQLRGQLMSMGVPEEILNRQDQAQLGQFKAQYERERSYLPLDLWVWTQYPQAD